MYKSTAVYKTKKQTNKQTNKRKKTVYKFQLMTIKILHIKHFSYFA